MKKTALAQVVAFAVSLFVAASTVGEIYRWTDEQGQVHFTDEPPPNQGEKVELEITPPSRYPDEGETRRQRLLESARRQTEHDEAVERTREPPAAVAVANTADCMPARHRWYALNQDMPVYWTAEGTIRGRWVGDTYSGEREYISDAERSRLLAVTARQLEQVCANGNSDEEDGSGYQEWLRADDCLLSKHQLEQALAPKSRSSKQKRREMEARVRENCT